MHWFQSVDSADKNFSSAARSPPKGAKVMKDGAVYTVSCGAARCGYPQARMGGNPSVYITLLTLSDHLSNLAALLEAWPRTGRILNRLWPLEQGAGKGYETHISAQQDQARTHARIPCPHGDESRAPRLEAPSRQRPRTVDAVTRRTSAATTSNNPGLISSQGNRFTKNNRLLDAASYGRVFDGATRSRDEFFTVLCRRNKQSIARLGLAISKKHCRKATVRNRIKRIIRESFRQQQALLTDLDVVVINRPAATLATGRQISDSLDRHWQRCSKAKTREPRKDG
jgi:ribonuclease P protein component